MTDQQLWALARKAGEQLFAAHGTGLVLGPLERVERVKLSQLQEGDEYSGGNYVDEYEFVFFPSKGTGLDVSSEYWSDAKRSWQDVDGKIYTAYAEGILRIITVDVPLREARMPRLAEVFHVA